MPYIPKKTLALCNEKEYECILKVKENQPNLYGLVKETCENGEKLDTYQRQEINRGRIESRSIELYAFPVEAQKEWQNMHVIIRLTRSGWRQKRQYCHQNYYIATICEEAETFYEYLRAYWGIENKLHYVKDVRFEQDENGLKMQNMPANVSIINGFCISVLRRKCGNNIKLVQEAIANKIEILCQLIE